MNRSESKYYNTACLIDEAFLLILEKKDFEYITVGEICKKAGVNRSTFYLHYENLSDLLDESLKFINDRFLEFFPTRTDAFNERVSNCPLGELDFINDEYLLPYLDFIRKNKKIYGTVVKNCGLFKLDNTYEKMVKHVFNPILERFSFPDMQKRFVIGFYINGIMAIVAEWLKSDCNEPSQEIAEIIKKCIKPRFAEITEFED